MRVKHAWWFKAGPEVDRASILLSDGAFKLYFYMCRNADRNTGSLTISERDLARAVAKSQRSIVTYSKELRQHSVCKIQPAVNQHRKNCIEICDEFWPYPKVEKGLTPSDTETYFMLIRAHLAARACVKCAFSAADQKFAADLLARQVSVEQIERAILLGCSRKYVSWLNGSDSGAIVSLAYFRELIEEVGGLEMPPEFWAFQKLVQLKRYEDQWIAKGGAAGANSAPATRRKSKKTK
jgi:hypothetical protein